MLRRTLMAGMLLAPLILSACDSKDASGPQGTNGAVTVNAYVDADGSGTLNAGDVGLAGKTVTLTGQDGEAFTATTSAEGVAQFEDVPPGSYTASLSSGTFPDGAVLATAATPVVVVPFQGGSFTTEFRFVLNPGSITGQLYRDNNGNNVFDAGDTPAPGMTVVLYPGSDTTAAALANLTPVATVTTDATGTFTFNTIRPGAYVVKVNGIPTITIVGGSVQAVTVGANVATPFPVKFTGNLIGTIAEARAAANNSTVAFEGIATVAQGTFASPSGSSQQIYMQDATGGVLVFGLPATLGVVAGDSLRVIGTKTTFSGEVEITISAPGQGVTKLGTKSVPAPKSMTEAQAVALQHLGELVTIPNLLVRNIGSVSGSTGSYNVGVGGPAPSDTFTIRVPSSNTGIPVTTFVVGQRYDVTGEMGVFNGVANLKPRSPADVVARSSATPIGAVRANNVAGDTVTVEGVVYVGTGNFNVASAYIMDKTGGINIFNVPSGTTLVPGDSIRVRGLVTFFSGEMEVARFSSSSPPVIEKLGTGAIPQPTLINYTALASKEFDGSLVKLLGLKVVSTGTVSGTTGSYNVNVTAPGGQTMVVRVDNAATGIPVTFWQIGQTYDVAGAAVNFVSGGNTTPQIKPRNLQDIVTSSAAAPARTIGDIRALFAGQPSTFSVDSATVDGVVIAGRGTFNSGSIYIYDGTGAIQVFNVPTTLTLVPGDYVRVHGKVVQFGTQRELEFTNAVPAGDTFSVTKLGQGPVVGPDDITGAELVAHVNEGELVRLQNVTVTSVTTQSSPNISSYTVNGTAADGTAIIIFMSAPTGAVPGGLFTVGNKYDITGIEVPFVTGGNTIGELKPRGAFDVVAR